MTRVSERVRVDVPVRAAYDRWTQFEDFPSFMQQVRDVEQLDPRNLRWTVDAAGTTVSFDTEITEQIPDARIAWRTTSGPTHAGAVDFHRLGEAQTEIEVAIEVDETSVPGVAAPGQEVLERSVRTDLERFKAIAEQKGPTRGWRGEIRPEGSGEGITLADRIATGLVTVGALEWGLVAATGRDLVAILRGQQGGRPSPVQRVVFGVVGAAGAYSVVRFGLRAVRRRGSTT